MKKLSVIAACILLTSFAFRGEKQIRIFMAGDSTMQQYNTDKTPQRGWGQVLPLFFDQDTRIINKARGGRSTKSFIHEGLWQQLLDSLRPGDWVLIEFGHNDHDKRKPERYTPPDDYKKNLIKMVNDVRAKGAHPVLLTPIAMRSFDSGGVYHDGHGPYPGKVKEAGTETGTPVIDLDGMFGAAVSQLGPTGSKKWFMNFGPGLYPEFPEGHKDNTHLREAGAMEVATLATAAIRRLKIMPLAEHLKKR